MSNGVRLGPLAPAHRDQLEAIVRATGVFAEGEVAVALELFDDSIGRSKTENGKPGVGELAGAHSPFPILHSPAPDYEFVGAFGTDGALIGYSCFGATPSTDSTFDLYWIAVHPAAQRLGAGGVLMSEVERRLQGRRARLLVVETSSRAEYAPTRQFYRKRGYEIAACVRDYYGQGDDRVILTKPLAVA